MTRWGYTNSGVMRHRLDGDGAPINEGACCGRTPKACCLLGNALCDVLLVGEISEKKLQYWPECLHCERMAHND